MRQGCCCRRDVFAIVHYQEQPAPAERLHKRLFDGFAALLGHAEYTRNRKRNCTLIRYSSQINKPRPIGKLWCAPQRCCNGKTGFAHAAHAKQRD